MRMLVVAPHPFFAYRGTPFSVYYRTLISAELGVPCDLLTYGQGADVSLPGVRIYRIPAMRWLGEVRVGPSLLKLFLDLFMVGGTIGLLCRRRYRVVHAHEEAVFWCVLLKPLFRFRLIYDMHSSLPEQLHNFRFTRSRIVHRIFEWFERRAIREADAVITICPALLSQARSLVASPDKVYLIENSIVDPIDGIDPEASVDAALNEATAALGWLAGRPDGRTLVYAGTLEPYQGIDRLLRAMVIVTREVPGAGLVVAGGRPLQAEAYRALAQELGLADDVFFAGQLTHADTQTLLRRCVAAVSPRDAGNNTPMKIYELIANRVPLIATRIESHTQVLSDEHCVLTGLAPVEMAQGIIQALRDPDRLAEKARRAEAWYRDRYARDSYSRKLRTLIARVAA